MPDTSQEPQAGIRVPTDAAPSFWNRDALTGFMVGMGVPALIFPVTAVIGMMIGGFSGRSRMEEEKEKGALVTPPTAWNREAAIGAGIGSFVLGVAGLAIGRMIGFQSANDLLGALAVAQVGAVLGSIAGIAVGGVIGATAGRQRMEHEWAEAKQYVAEHGEYQGRAAELAGKQNQVTQNIYVATPEEAAALQQKLQQGGNVSFAERSAPQPDAASLAPR